MFILRAASPPGNAGIAGCRCGAGGYNRFSFWPFLEAAIQENPFRLERCDGGDDS
jgi:hypothetical protein